VNVRGLEVEREVWWRGLSRRMWKVDNRENTLEFIHKTLEGGITEMEELRRKSLSEKTLSGRNICKKILKDIMKSKCGIETLKETYMTDVYFCCGIDTYLEQIDAYICELKMEDSKLFEEDEETDTCEYHENTEGSVNTSNIVYR